MVTKHIVSQNNGLTDDTDPSRWGGFAFEVDTLILLYIISNNGSLKINFVNLSLCQNFSFLNGLENEICLQNSLIYK